MTKCVLGDYILDMASGPFGSNLKVECFVPSGFPIIDGANLYGVRVTDNVTKFVTEEKARSLSRSIAKRHDVIVTISGTLGQVAYIPSDSLYEEYLCSQRQFRVTFDESKIDVEYLVNLLHTDYGQKKILSFANYVGVPALSQPLPNFRRIELELPDIEKQHKVAKIISTIDRKIALNRKRIATLEAMAKEIYDYWFVQFDFPDAHGRPYKSSGGAMVYNPDLKREIPKGWEVVRIGDVLDRHILSTNKIPAKAYGQFGAYPIIDQSEKFIAGYTDDKNAILDYPFCTVFGDHSCELKAVNFPFARGADGTQIVVSADANVPNVQLYFALRMMDFGGGYKRHFVLAKDSLIVKDAIGVAAPRFEKVEKAIFDGIKHCRFENFKLTGLRDFLLPVLMNGQVKVR